MKYLEKTGFIYGVAIAASLLLSLWISVQAAIVNPDAICYLLSADMVGKDGLNAAMHLCTQSRWPFYSALIFYFSQLTHLSLTVSAYLLDGLFSAISVVTFISIVKELGASSRVLWLAAMVILLAHDFNSVREYIDRDHGYWAFYLVSLLCLLRYVRQPAWLYAIAWSFSLVMATLFRIEGAIFLMAMPFIIWFCTNYSWGKRLTLFLMLNILAILGCVGIGLWLVLHPQHNVSQLGRVAEIGNQLQHGFAMMLGRFHAMKAGLEQHVLTSDSVKQAGLVLTIIFVGWYAASVVASVSCIYALLIIYAWSRKALTLPKNAALVICAYLGMNVIITFGFLVEHTFLSKRYLIALSLVLMLWVPFALEALIKQSQSLRQRLVLLLIMFLIVITAVGGIFNCGHSKLYIHDAGDWMATNIPANKTVYMNDIQLMYYSKQYGDEIFKQEDRYRQSPILSSDQLKQYDYLALRSGKLDDKQLVKMKPIQVFMNARGDNVAIYKVQK